MKMKFSNSFKCRCVEMYIGEGIPARVIAKIMGVSRMSVNRWVNQIWFGKAEIRYPHYKIVSYVSRESKATS